MRALSSRPVLLFALLGGATLARAQTTPQQTTEPPPQPSVGGYRLIQPRTVPSISPAVLVLLEQESRFQQAVATGGGAAFGSFFTDDAVVLSNGQPAVQGKAAIATQAAWDAKSYQLTWQPQGAQMGPSGDEGFTWGHYDGRLLAANGSPDKPSTTSGRYITVWRRVGTEWKVALEASANEPASEPAAAVMNGDPVPHP